MVQQTDLVFSTMVSRCSKLCCFRLRQTMKTALASIFALTFLLHADCTMQAAYGSKPNIVFLFVDNVGWANLGFHRSNSTPEVVTPHLDYLAKSGIELDRHYTYKFCSPSRSSFLSGRLPVHVNIYNDDPAFYNPNTGASAGVPVNMTMISTKLKSVGYVCHFVGKWHVGMATTALTPLGRSFNTSLGYFHSENDYFTQKRHQVLELTSHHFRNGS